MPTPEPMLDDDFSNFSPKNVIPADKAPKKPLGSVPIKDVPPPKKRGRAIVWGAAALGGLFLAGAGCCGVIKGVFNPSPKPVKDPTSTNKTFPQNTQPNPVTTPRDDTTLTVPRANANVQTQPESDIFGIDVQSLSDSPQPPTTGVRPAILPRSIALTGNPETDARNYYTLEEQQVFRALKYLQVDSVQAAPFYGADKKFGYMAGDILGAPYSKLSKQEKTQLEKGALIAFPAMSTREYQAYASQLASRFTIEEKAAVQEIAGAFSRYRGSDKTPQDERTLKRELDNVLGEQRREAASEGDTSSARRLGMAKKTIAVITLANEQARSQDRQR